MIQKLETLPDGASFRCPWNGKIFTLINITPSAAWVEVIEEIKFEVKNKKTGIKKVIETTKKKNEPWSRGTMVEPINL